MAIINKIIEIKGRRWLIKEAKSMNHAINEITMARATGSIGGRSVIDETLIGGGVIVLADVVVIENQKQIT